MNEFRYHKPYKNQATVKEMIKPSVLRMCEKNIFKAGMNLQYDSISLKNAMCSINATISLNRSIFATVNYWI